MKAVILAGGEGTRLRPMSCHRPKPMVKLLDKPVLEHLLAYLRQQNIKDVCMTLQTMPYAIKDYFGSGDAFGVSIQYTLETTPLGTAGAVKACAEFIGEDEDFLVISGDAVLDLDLRPCLALHQKRNAEATLVLHRQESLLEYGLVMTEPNGRISRFIEKPSWGQVFCDTVNTGIYIVSRKALDKIPPEGFYDFARDLFPQMLAEGAPLYGLAAQGYWCDIGDCEAYRQCCFDVLDGKVSLFADTGGPEECGWDETDSLLRATVIPPCFIGGGVVLGEDVTIGPYAVLGEGCQIDDRAQVSRSVLDNVHVGQDAMVQGGVLCAGSVLKQGAMVLEGAVLGDNVVIGEHAVVAEGARVWPDKEVEEGARIIGSLTEGQRRLGALFDGQGKLEGEANVEITPDFCLRLGCACGKLFGGEIGLSYEGGEAARIAALSLEAGICAAGGRCVTHDANTAAVAAFLASYAAFGLSLHVEETGGVLAVSFFESDGLPLRHIGERKLEGLVLRGESPLAHSRSIGVSRRMSGMVSLYAAAAVQSAGIGDVTRIGPAVSVMGRHAAAEHLRQVLTSLGCRVSSAGGLPSFDIDESGFLLGAVDESGTTIAPPRILSLLAMLEWEAGQRTVALPYHAPAAVDVWAKRHKVRLLRPERDGEDARRLLSATPFFRDGVFAAAHLCAAVMKSGGGLRRLNEKLIPFAVTSVEVPISGDRGAVMRNLADSFIGEQRELYDGLRARIGEGWVHIAPLPNRRSLRITGEGANEEIAADLCDLILHKARELDTSRQVQ